MVKPVISSTAIVLENLAVHNVLEGDTEQMRKDEASSACNAIDCCSKGRDSSAPPTFFSPPPGVGCSRTACYTSDIESYGSTAVHFVWLVLLASGDGPPASSPSRWPRDGSCAVFSRPAQALFIDRRQEQHLFDSVVMSP